jgi:hypothetical protein
MTDAVEKGFCGSLRATLIQDQKSMRNLDSKIRLPGSFRILIPQFLCRDFFVIINPFRTCLARARFFGVSDIGSEKPHPAEAEWDHFRVWF